MDIKFFDHGFPFIIVDDLYDPEELEEMGKEMQFLHDKGVFLDPVDSYSAWDENGFLKNNKCIHLDEYFAKKREKSVILAKNRKIFTENILESSKNWFFANFIKTCDYDSTLLSYYENNNYYRAHTDSAFVTGLCWFYQEPKRFKGGEFLFPDYKVDIEVVNNRMIFFPSFIKHQVIEVRLEPKYQGKNLGRWCMTQFLDSKSIADTSMTQKRREIEEQAKSVLFNR